MARRLAGARARHAVVYVCGDPRERTLAQIARTDLARIRMTVSVLEDEQCPRAENGGAPGKSARADLLVVSGWPFMEADEREPVQILDQALQSGAYGSPLPPGWWTGPAFRSRLDRARALQGGQRLRAYRRLADHFTRSGPLAVFGDWVWPEYFSPKVGCKVFQATYAVADLGALCKQS
jgi:hypothetical protein